MMTTPTIISAVSGAPKMLPVAGRIKPLNQGGPRVRGPGANYCARGPSGLAAPNYHHQGGGGGGSAIWRA